MSLRVEKGRRPGLGISSKCATSSLPSYGYSSASKELKDVLERKIEDLSRQLAEERQAARRDKILTTRLQRELVRHKTDKPGKENLSRELERERMLRTDAEQRLQEMTKESDGCRSRLQDLQEEFKKMEEMVQNMVPYKSKIDQLKQEKTSLSLTYDNNLQKFGSHINDLERENMMLLNEVKKLESQTSNKSDGRDRSKLLLERLRMLEGENSSLVLENEQQRHQYERCLDEIANQVVQALLAQKMLREECVKLQNRVCDLELQNRQLCMFFQQRMKYSPESMQGVLTQGQDQPCPESGVYIHGSMESLQSMFSEQMSEHLAVLPSMGTPPPWLQERLSFPGDRLSVVSIPGSVHSTPDLTEQQEEDQSEFSCRTTIETEFPATPSSPKVKHINVFERKRETKRSSSVSSLTSNRPNKVRTRSTSSLSKAKGLSLFNQSSASMNSRNSPTSKEAHSKQGKNSNSERSKSHSELTNMSSTNHSSSSPQQHSASTNQGKISPAGTNSSQSELTNSNLTISANHNQSVPSRGGHGNVSSNSSHMTLEHGSQGQATSSTNQSPVSRIPVQASPTQSRQRTPQLRRKSDSGIKMGNQALTGRPSSQSPSPATPVSSTSKLSNYTYRSSSTESGSPPNGNDTNGTRIPTVSSSPKPPSTGNRNSSQEKTVPQSKLKPPNVRTTSGVSKPGRGIPSPVPKLLSGIKTSVRDDSARSKGGNSSSVNSMQNGGKKSSHDSVGKVSSGSSVSSSGILVRSNVNGQSSLTSEGKGAGSRIPSLHGDRGESPSHYQYPRMGYSTAPMPTSFASATSRVSDTSTVYSNGMEVGKSDLSFGKGENCSNGKKDNSAYSQKEAMLNSSGSQVPKGQYFYDYSDEDSDFNRPISKAFSTASSVSLDDLLDETLENIETPVDSDFTTETFFLLNTSHVTSLNNKLYLQTDTEPGVLSGKEQVRQEHQEPQQLLQGKPDIVKDTEKCERQNLKKSQTSSSGSAGYRARRPRSLILDPKDKQILFCEYNTSSADETDTSSDEEWSYQYSYAKNIKQHKLQAKISSISQKTEKVSPSVAKDVIMSEMNVSVENEKNEKSSKLVSQIPRPNVSKKTIKTPPPVARKPMKKKSPVNQQPESSALQKSVDICVNTVVVQDQHFLFMEDVISPDKSKYRKEKLCKIPLFKDTSNHPAKVRLDNPECKFDGVKVERSGSKDDGYSTMSSDIQPEILEKYADANDKKCETNESDPSCKVKDTQRSRAGFDIGSDPDSALESSIHSNDIRNSNLSLSSQNSFSSEERQTTTHGSLGRVRAMKMMFDAENQKQSEERDRSMSPKSPSRSSPVTPPPKTLPKPSSPKPILKSSAPASESRIPCLMTNRSNPSKALKLGTNVSEVKSNVPSPVLVKTIPDSNSEAFLEYKEKAIKEFNDMSYFTPTLEQISFLREGSYDSSSSASERGSDLTSLHISEDNILSDIPEEKDEYESSVEKQSEATSVTSLKMCQKFKFQMTLKRQWASLEGLARARSDSDIDRQRLEQESADYDEMYGGNLNMDTPLERSASESDMHRKGDHSSIKLSPRLHRSHYGSLVDEIAVEEKVQIILKQQLFHQFSQAAHSGADSDLDDFTKLADVLRQKGHVMDSPDQERSATWTTQNINQISQKSFKLTPPTPSDFSSKGCYSSLLSESFELEEKQSGADEIEEPFSPDKKRFNSQFYSLCDVGHVGSHPNVSTGDDKDNGVTMATESNRLPHTCTCQTDKNKNCKRCVEDSHEKDFDEISRQIESLSKTVNDLHRSLSSLHSDNEEKSGDESNEGDQSSYLTSAIGNKEIDGYQWVEDEFFLSPYGGEIILGNSPFSDTGASCDWMNEYMDDSGHCEDHLGEREAMQEAPAGVANFVHQLKHKGGKAKTPIAPHKSSILVGSIDEEGNFDSHEFISRRLKLEEERLQAEGLPRDLTSELESNLTIQLPQRYKKEESHTIPEKDEETLRTSQMKRSGFMESMMYGCLGNSQDSLDDNIGVDRVMCHRLLGKNEMHLTSPSSRAAADLSTHFYTRYGDQEKKAMAAFDFLQEMSTSASSCDQSRSAMSREEEKRLRRNRRKLRPKQKRDLHQGDVQRKSGFEKDSSTSPDSPNDASCDEISFSDTCADSYSTSSLEEYVNDHV